MRTALFILAIATVTAGAAPPVPDFSGTWTIDAAKSASVGGGQGGGRGTGGGLGLGPSPERVVITQNATTLTAAEHRGEETATIVYRLDGRASTNKLPAGRSAGSAAEYVSHWDRDRLVTVFTVPGANGAASARYQEVRTLDASGAMRVEITLPGLTNARKVVYARASGGN